MKKAEKFQRNDRKSIVKEAGTIYAFRVGYSIDHFHTDRERVARPLMRCAIM